MTKKEFLDRWMPKGISDITLVNSRMVNDLDAVVHSVLLELGTAKKSHTDIVIPEVKKENPLNEWKPTHRLRWHRYNVKEILQQLWKDEFGNLRWQDVPVEDEI